MRLRQTVAITVPARTASAVFPQDNLSLNDLKIRAEAGDKTATCQIAGTCLKKNVQGAPSDVVVRA